MGYTIEVSFDIRVQKNITNTKSSLREKAQESNCESNYFMFEIEGRGRKIERNHCVFVVLFDTNQISDILYFLHKIREDRYIYIECIYRDDGIHNLIHASPLYLQRIDKNFAKQFKKQRKTQNLSSDELKFLNIIKSKKV